jgi:hypothetical protein
MGLSTYATAFLLLAGALVLTVAGASAMSASYDSANETASGNAPGADGAPPVLEVGKDIQSTLVSALPWIGLAAVPMAIIGILGSLAFVRKSGRGRRRRGF